MEENKSLNFIEEIIDNWDKLYKLVAQKPLR